MENEMAKKKITHRNEVNVLVVNLFHVYRMPACTYKNILCTKDTILYGVQYKITHVLGLKVQKKKKKKYGIRSDIKWIYLMAHVCSTWNVSIHFVLSDSVFFFFFAVWDWECEWIWRSYNYYWTSTSNAVFCAQNTRIFRDCSVVNPSTIYNWFEYVVYVRYTRRKSENKM